MDHPYPGLTLTDSLKAIANARRTAWDKWMRKEWHKAAARERWTEALHRQARWILRRVRSVCQQAARGQ